MSRFQLSGLDHREFQPLFRLDDASLALGGMVRCTAESSPGYPCRVSLEEAQVGEEVLLLPYQHQSALSPYRSSGAIYVRRGATQALLAPGVIPALITQRLISLRAYDQQAMMLMADVCDGDQVAGALEQIFTRRQVAYVHLHNARQGCFACVAHRRID